jgi:hypothetical protein
VPVRCEEVRDRFPEYAAWGPRPTGDIGEHLATCADCRAELAAYRRMLVSLAALRDVEEPAPDGYLERTLTLVPEGVREKRALDWRGVSDRVVAAARRRPAVASVTGVALGVAAVGLIAWRRGRRTLRDATRVPELAAQ